MIKYHTRSKKVNKKELARMLGIDYSTIFNWEKNRPELFNLILDGLKYRNLKDILKEIAILEK